MRRALPAAVSLATAVALAIASGCHGGSSSGGGDAGASGDDAGAPPTGPPAEPVFPDADPSPPRQIGRVTPSTAFLARHHEIRIDGYAVAWTNATRVDLGPDVTISNLSAPVPDLLVVDFGVAATAAQGPRDVLVVDGDGGALVAVGALSIAPPASLAVTGGALAQGSIALAHLHVDDPSVPLDTTATKDPFGNVTYTNLALSASGISGSITKAAALDADIELFVDVTTTGAHDFDLLSGAAGSAQVEHFPIPGALDVTARAPARLAAGAPLTGPVAAPYATTLARYTPTSATPTIVDFQATSTAGGADPAVLLLPASGAWRDELIGGATATWLATLGDPIYAVYFDDAGTTGQYSLAVAETPAAATAAATPADATQAGAVAAAALPFVLTGGLLTSSASQDWVRVTTGPGDAGKRLLVQSAGDPRTFLDVTLYDADGVTSIGGNETGGPVHASSKPLAASATYYVVFSAGGGFDPAHGGYAGIVRIQ